MARTCIVSGPPAVSWPAEWFGPLDLLQPIVRPLDGIALGLELLLELLASLFQPGELTAARLCEPLLQLLDSTLTRRDLVTQLLAFARQICDL
jgi:hypothetical protein